MTRNGNAQNGSKWSPYRNNKTKISIPAHKYENSISKSKTQNSSIALLIQLSEPNTSLGSKLHKGKKTT